MGNKVSISILGIKDFKVFLEKLDSLKEKGFDIADFHIDVMDGEFVENANELHTALMIELLERGYNPEVHLMVSETLEAEIMKAIRYGAKKIWIHVELQDAEKYLNIINGVNRKEVSGHIDIGLAINPNTPIEDVAIFKDKIDSVLIMSVNPGKGGQKYIKSSYEKIKKAKELLGAIEIVVDGGINESNVIKILSAGATKVVMGHYLTANINKLKGKLGWLKKHIDIKR